MIACLGGRGLVARRVLVTSRSVSRLCRRAGPLPLTFRGGRGAVFAPSPLPFAFPQGSC